MAENYHYSSLSGEEIENRLIGGVLFNTDQDLTTSQKAIARANIGAGESNSTFKILSYFDTLQDLQDWLQQLPQAGDAYGIGTESPYDVYVWDGVHNVWVNNGQIAYSDALIDDEDVSINRAWSSSKISTELSGKQAKISVSGLLKGNGSGDVSSAVAGTDYLTPATNYSPVKEVSGNYTLIASDIGKTLAATSNGTTITIPRDVWSGLPGGAEIAFFRYSLTTEANLIVDCTAITGLRGCVDGTPTVISKFKINNGYDLVAIKKLNPGNSFGMVVGNVEVVS